MLHLAGAGCEPADLVHVSKPIAFEAELRVLQADEYRIEVLDARRAEPPRPLIEQRLEARESLAKTRNRGGDHVAVRQQRTQAGEAAKTRCDRFGCLDGLHEPAVPGLLGRAPRSHPVGCELKSAGAGSEIRGRPVIRTRENSDDSAHRLVSSSSAVSAAQATGRSDRLRAKFRRTSQIMLGLSSIRRRR